MHFACAGGDSAADASETGPTDVADADELSGDIEAGDSGDPGDLAPDDGGPAEADSSEVEELPNPYELPWRSVLYPEDWEPGLQDAEGHFLHDFSYAGYRGGGVPLPDTSGPAVVDVVLDHGADPTGETDCTDAVQAAIDAVSAAGGGVVGFPAGLFRFDGTLYIGASNVVLRGAGPEVSRLFFTKVEGMAYRSHVLFEGKLGSAPEVLLAADGASRDTVVRVDDPGELAVGDDVAVGWVITPEFIEEHGMTGTWKAFNDTWQPFFRREIVAIDADQDPPAITLDVPLRYPAEMRDQASLRREDGYIEEVGFESLGISNAVDYDAAWSLYQVGLLEMRGVKDGWIRDVVSFVSPVAPAEGPGSGAHLQSGGIKLESCKRVTVADSELGLAQNRGGGGCGYLYQVRRSSEVLFRDDVAREGRHNFIQNWGFGATGIVWLRVHSEGGVAMDTKDLALKVGNSEFHHSLATANLIDSSTFDDGFSAINRRDESTGAGHTATETVFWNVGGRGSLRSYQYGMGYVIGTGPALDVLVEPQEAPPGLEEVFELFSPWGGTEPMDWTEGMGWAETLVPSSLYEDQLARRLGTP